MLFDLMILFLAVYTEDIIRNVYKYILTKGVHIICRVKRRNTEFQVENG